MQISDTTHNAIQWMTALLDSAEKEGYSESYKNRCKESITDMQSMLDEIERLEQQSADYAEQHAILEDEHNKLLGLLKKIEWKDVYDAHTLVDDPVEHEGIATPEVYNQLTQLTGGGE